LSRINIGSHIFSHENLSGFSIPTKASNWWKSIVAIDKVVPDRNWFVKSFARKVGDGYSTFFWTIKWIGETPLALAFPRLFSLSNEKESMVGDLLSSEGERRSWLLTWRKRLFQWEEENLAHLVNLLEMAIFSSDEDGWSWLPDSDGVFSVNSAYKLLMKFGGKMIW
jgi:hypothetical protein